MHFYAMSMPWFFEATPVDHLALEQLRSAALAAATALEDARGRRVRSTARYLLRCAGPFADELVERCQRAAARDEDLAAACRGLAQLAHDAAAAAHLDAARRQTLRDAFTVELHRDALRAAANAAANAAAHGNANGTTASVAGAALDRVPAGAAGVGA